jgi:hypothetical protein
MAGVSPNRRHERQWFYKYATAEATKAVLRTRTLRWSSPTCFNDPFDVPRQAVLDFDAIQLRACVRADFEAVLEGRLPTSHPVLRLLHGIYLKNPNPDMRAAINADLNQSFEKMTTIVEKSLDDFRRVWTEMVNELRVLCLSEVNDSPQMWAYYSGNNSGAVLRLDAIDDVDSSLLLAHPVVYRDEPPSLPGKEEWARVLVEDREMNWLEAFKEYYYVKAGHWRHECEWRVLTYKRPGETGAFSDWPYHPVELGGVFLGASMATEDAEEIVGLLTGELAQVQIHKAEFDHIGRRIVFHRAR